MFKLISIYETAYDIKLNGKEASFLLLRRFGTNPINLKTHLIKVNIIYFLTR